MKNYRELMVSAILLFPKQLNSCTNSQFPSMFCSILKTNLFLHKGYNCPRSQICPLKIIPFPTRFLTTNSMFYPFPKQSIVFTTLKKRPFENSMEKGENAGNLLFPQCFLTYQGQVSSFKIFFISYRVDGVFFIHSLTNDKMVDLLFQMTN